MVSDATGNDAITGDAVTQRRLRHDMREQATAISWAAAELVRMADHRIT